MSRRDIPTDPARFEERPAHPPEVRLRDDLEYAVSRAMNKLTRQQAEVIRMRTYGKMTFEEIGEARGTDRAAAWRLHDRATKVLRKHLLENETIRELMT